MSDSEGKVTLHEGDAGYEVAVAGRIVGTAQKAKRVWLHTDSRTQRRATWWVGYVWKTREDDYHRLYRRPIGYFTTRRAAVLAITDEWS